MDPFDVKSEKANAILRYRRLQKIAAVFRFLELLVFLIVVSRFSYQLPLALKLSTQYLHGFSGTLLNPPFVFVIGNTIVAILFLNSGQTSVKRGGENDKNLDFYEEFVRRCEKSTEVVPVEERKMHRSRSESLIGEDRERNGPKLRRTKTERRARSSALGEEGSARKLYREDELSSEEFRITVEAFIARQQKSLRDEEFSPMVYVGP